MEFYEALKIALIIYLSIYALIILIRLIAKITKGEMIGSKSLMMSAIIYMIVFSIIPIISMIFLHYFPDSGLVENITMILCVVNVVGFSAWSIINAVDQDGDGIFNVYDNFHTYFNDVNSYKRRINRLKKEFKLQTQWETLKNN